MTETYVTEEGRIDVLTLPMPLGRWVWNLCFDRGVGKFTFAGGYEVSLDELASVLRAGGLPGVLESTH